MKPVMATSCNTKKDNNTEGGKFGEIPDPEGDLFRDPYWVRLLIYQTESCTSR